MLDPRRAAEAIHLIRSRTRISQSGSWLMERWAFYLLLFLLRLLLFPFLSLPRTDLLCSRILMTLPSGGRERERRRQAMLEVGVCRKAAWFDCISNGWEIFGKDHLMEDYRNIETEGNERNHQKNAACLNCQLILNCIEEAHSSVIVIVIHSVVVSIFWLQQILFCWWLHGDDMSWGRQ